LGFSTGGFVTATAICLVILFTMVFKPVDIPLFYTDEDLVSVHISFNELENNYGILLIYDVIVENPEETGILLPERHEFEYSEANIFQHNDTETIIYTKLIYTSAKETLQVSIVFVDNYKLVNQNIYDNLEREYLDNRFICFYSVENNILYAKFYYEDNWYYISYFSELSPKIEVLLAMLQ